MKRILEVLLVLLLYVSSFGAQYYVSSSGGSDTYAGTATNVAWATMAKINGSTFSPGDTISLKKGDTWRETLTPPSAGTYALPIRFTSYGAGSNPIIDASYVFDEWFQVGANGDITNDNFETGSFKAGVWGTGTANCSVVTWGSGGEPAGDGTAGGTYGLKIPATKTLDITLGTSTYSFVNFDFYVRMPASGGGDQKLMAFYNNDGTPALIGTLRLRDMGTSYKLFFYNNVTSQSTTASTAMAFESWHRLSVIMITDFRGLSANNYGNFNVLLDGSSELALYSAAQVNFGAQKKVSKVSFGFADTTSILYLDAFRYTRGKLDVANSAGLWTQYTPTAYVNTAGQRPKIYTDNVCSGLMAANLAAVDSTGDWFADNDGTYPQYFMYDNPTGKVINIPILDAAINIGGAKNFLTFDNLTLKRSRQNLVAMSGGADGAVKRIRFENMTISDALYAGFSLGFDTKGIIIKNCTISGCWHSAIFANQAATNTMIPRDLTIINNTLYNNHTEGIALEKVGDCLIQGNLIYNTLIDTVDGGYGIGIYVNTGTGVDILDGCVKILNNVIYNAEQYGVWVSDGDNTKCIGPVLLYNNIIVAVANNSQALRYTLASAASKLLDTDYNCYWHAYDASNVMIYCNGNYNRTQFATWQSNSGQDTHSICGDPRLYNTSLYDFRLSTNSPCLNTGMPTLGGGYTSIGAWQRNQKWQMKFNIFGN